MTIKKVFLSLSSAIILFSSLSALGKEDLVEVGFRDTTQDSLIGVESLGFQLMETLSLETGDKSTFIYALLLNIKSLQL